MRVIIFVLTILAFALIIYNATKINLESPFKEESTIAIITILASLCAILLLQILRISKKIEKKSLDK